MVLEENKLTEKQLRRVGFANRMEKKKRLGKNGTITNKKELIMEAKNTQQSTQKVK